LVRLQLKPKHFIPFFQSLIKHQIRSEVLKEEMFVQLKDGKKISVSRRKKKDFLEKTKSFLGNLEIY
jgi:hypothetical protein